MRTTAFILVLLVFLSACKKADIEIPDDAFRQVFDFWELVETSSEPDFHIETPDDRGYRSYLELSIQGDALYYQNDTLLDFDHFQFVDSEELHPASQSSYLIEFKKGGSFYFEARNDTLFLWQNEGAPRTNYVYRKSATRIK